MFSKLRTSLFLLLLLYTSLSFGQIDNHDISAVIDDIRAANDKVSKTVTIQKLLDTLTCFAEQQKNFDFLESEYQLAKRNKWTDLQKKIGIKYMNINFCNDNYEASIKYCEEIKQLALQEKDTISWLAAHLREGAYHRKKEEYDKAKKKFQIGYEWSKRIDSKLYMAYFLEEIGYVYIGLNDVDTFIEYYQKASQLYSKQSHLAKLANNRFAMGFHSKYYSGYRDSSIRYYEESLSALSRIKHPTPKDLNLKGHVLQVFTSEHLGLMSSRDSAIHNYLTVLDLLQNGRNAVLKSNCTYYLGNEYYSQGNYTKALEYYKLSLDFTKKTEDQYNISWSEAVIGSMHHQMGEYKKALPLIQNFIKKSKEKGNYGLQVEYQTILAKVYLALKDYAMAMNLIDEVLAECKKDLEYSKSRGVYFREAKLVKGNIYIAQGQYNQAEVLLQTVLDSVLLKQQVWLYSAAYTALGTLKNKQNLHEEALVYLKKSLDEAKQRGQKLEIAEAYYQIGFTEQQLLQYSNAIQNYLMALDYTRDITHTPIFIEIYKGLSKCYAKTGDYRKAYEYQVKYKQTEDELLLEQQKREISELESDFLLKEKDTENELLKKEQAMNASAIRQRNLLLIGLLIIVALITFIAFTLRKVNQKEKQQNQVLEEQVEKRTQELLTSNLELEEIKQKQILEEAKSRFFANVSHEFRTPLTLIQAPIEKVLKDKNINTKNRNMLQKAFRNSKNLMRLVTDILDLGKIETEKVALNETSQVLYLFTRRVIANFETYAQSKNITLKLEYKANTDLQIEIDKDKFEKIINNYLSNALKFTPKNGNITVTVDDLKNKLQISVADTGQGIPANELEAVFERYYQVQSPDDNAPLGQVNHYAGGTGIGLALCKEYAELFNGKVWAESPNEHKGSTFYFEFPKKEIIAPLTDAAANAINESKNAVITPLLTPTLTNNQAYKAERPTILIVEDNYDLRQFVSELLEEEYNIITAENGQEALERLTVNGGRSLVPRLTEEANDAPSTVSKAAVHRLPSLIISDVMMPLMDGFELLENLKASDDFRHIPVMMLTARAEMKDKLKALRIGVDDYMLKPFHEEELMVRVKNLILNIQSRLDEISREKAEKTDEKTDEKTGDLNLQISEEDKEWLIKLENIIQEQMSDFKFKSDNVVYELHLSRTHVFKKVKELTGLTLNQYIKELRLQKARQLLETKQIETTKEASYAVGFKHINYFSTLFKERFGKRPSEY